MTDITGSKASLDNQATRKRRRLERELRALRTMEGHLTTKDIVCSLLTIPALALLCFAVAFKLSLISGSVPLAITGAIAGGIAIWWIGRRWFTLAVLIVYALILILFESAPDSWPDTGDEKSKSGRRAKLERAIAKREAMLRELDGTRP